MLVRLIDEREIMPAEDAAIRELLCVCFPADRAVFSRTRAWNGSAPAYCAVAEDQGRIVAHIGVVDRVIRIGETQLRAAGIQNVAVHPAHRGHGLAGQLMAPAMLEAENRHLDLGLLFCIPALAKMYGSLGWQLLPGTEITRIHKGQESPLKSGNIAMFYPLAMKVFPGGAIHLQGDDW